MSHQPDADSAAPSNHPINLLRSISKRGLRSELFKCFAIAREKKSLHDCFFAGESERDVNRSNRFLLRAAGWTSDSGGRERICRSCARPRTFGHCARHRLAHCTVFFDQIFIDAEHIDLGLVCVHDVASDENFGGARHVRNPIGEQSTGAGFRDARAFLFVP